MVQSPFPMPSAGQLRQLADAAERNAVDLAVDARLLLDASRFPRAYALAVLSLEELGKLNLCRAVLAGTLDEPGFRRAWSNHMAKLERSHLEAIMSAATAQRLLTRYDVDAAVKMRGLYVDANPDDANGAPVVPADVDPDAARDIVEAAESAATGAWMAFLEAPDGVDGTPSTASRAQVGSANPGRPSGTGTSAVPSSGTAGR